jgi:hypothetical protein
MKLAGGRSGHVFSEKIAEEIMKNGTITLNDYKDLSKLNGKITTAALIKLPVSHAEGYVALVTLGELAKRHELIKDIAVPTMKFYETWPGGEEIAKEYSQKLQTTQRCNQEASGLEKGKKR